MKRGPRRLDGLDDMLPGGEFVRDCIRGLAAAALKPTGRDYDFIERHKRGETLQEIGQAYGISRERVRQRLALYGIKSSAGGATARRVFKSLNAREIILQKRQDKSFRMFGVPESVYIQISGLQTVKNAWKSVKDGGHPILCAYLHQKRSTAKRGIGWEFTLETWWAVWQESGKWAERGRGKGYCMARWGDSGSYSPENVYICTCGQNFSDSYIVKPAAERIAKRRKNAEAANA